MKFIDEAVIEVASGNGGPGSGSFRREKYIERGGPDGGDGGKGGSVIIQATSNKHTLLDFKFNPLWRAKHGGAGSGSLKNGKNGEDLFISVPIGTQIIDINTKEILCDLSDDEETFVLAKGGRGGKGNDFFKSSTNQAPTHFQPGEPGEKSKFLLNLKLVADIGIIGLPNAGKSTFISIISSARPKIANYPFTTLTPNLGVVKSDSSSFVVADIPGLIPGASSGKGLGVKFLKHIERTTVLLHLVDPLNIDIEGNPIDPIEAFKLINDELIAFSPELEKKDQIVAISKCDTTDEEKLKEIQESFKALGIETFLMSSVSQAGVKDLLRELNRRVVADKK